MDATINIKNNHSPLQPRVSQPMDLIFYSQEHVSRFETFDVSGQVLNEKNKNILNLTNMTIVQKDSPQNKRYKENRYKSVQQKKIHQKLSRPIVPNEAKSNETNNDSHMILSIKEYDVSTQEQLVCIYCLNFTGQLMNYCICKKIHKNCLKKMNQELDLNLKDPQLRDKLTCSDCKTLVHIKLKNQFQLRKCHNISTILLLSLVSVVMFGIFSFLIYFIVSNKQQILFQPDLFSGIIFLTIISLMVGIWLAGIVLSQFNVWILHIKQYQQQKSICDENEKLVALVEKLNDN